MGYKNISWKGEKVKEKLKIKRKRRKQNDEEKKKQESEGKIVQDTDCEDLEMSVYTEVAICIRRFDLGFYL